MPTGKLIAENKFPHLEIKPIHIFQLVNMVQILFTITNVNTIMHSRVKVGPFGRVESSTWRQNFPVLPTKELISWTL